MKLESRELVPLNAYARAEAERRVAQSKEPRRTGFWVPDNTLLAAAERELAQGGRWERCTIEVPVTAKLGPLHRGQDESWSRDATIGGVTYRVGVYPGSRLVRIAYRGNSFGHHWYGWVKTKDTGTTIYEEQVTKSTGARWLLWAAGVFSIWALDAWLKDFGKEK